MTPARTASWRGSSTVHRRRRGRPRRARADRPSLARCTARRPRCRGTSSLTWSDRPSQRDGLRLGAAGPFSVKRDRRARRRRRRAPDCCRGRDRRWSSSSRRARWLRAARRSACSALATRPGRPAVRRRRGGAAGRADRALGPTPCTAKHSRVRAARRCPGTRVNECRVGSPATDQRGLGALDRPRPSQKFGTMCQVALGTQPCLMPPHESHVTVQLPDAVGRRADVGRRGRAFRAGA